MEINCKQSQPKHPQYDPMTTLISGHSHDFRKTIQTLIFYHLLFDCWMSDTVSFIFSAGNLLKSLQLLIASFFILRYLDILLIVLDIMISFLINKYLSLLVTRFLNSILVYQ